MHVPLCTRLLHRASSPRLFLHRASSFTAPTPSLCLVAITCFSTTTGTPRTRSPHCRSSRGSRERPAQCSAHARGVVKEEGRAGAWWSRFSTVDSPVWWRWLLAPRARCGRGSTLGFVTLGFVTLRRARSVTLRSAYGKGSVVHHGWRCGTVRSVRYLQLIVVKVRPKSLTQHRKLGRVQGAAVVHIRLGERRLDLRRRCGCRWGCGGGGGRGGRRQIPGMPFVFGDGWEGRTRVVGGRCS